ncbi:cytochrome P450 [Ascidiaceihabitans sp.]|uniref:cytochrome P450 n=1 Tax=Ascidiaceihabitans sp. TaxID=1872644 RepID=UPI003298D6EC
MSSAPHFDIDLAAFAADPYPQLAQMRAKAPIAWVPQLGATLFTCRDDIHLHEKRTKVFSSRQPGGLMTTLMGENMMRKDADAHMAERKAVFPALSPRTVATHWKPIFERAALAHIKALKPRGSCDLVADYAMPVSAMALKAITGLVDMSETEMDSVSQAMIDGCANYAGIQDIENRCHAATALIDAYIDQNLGTPTAMSALAVMKDAGLPMDSIRANIKLIISGGQNEPRDAIAGTIWALLSHPDSLDAVRNGRTTYADAFSEYARWMAPIGMSPREVAQHDCIDGITFAPGDRVFFMFGSACRDAAHFDKPDQFDVTRNTQAAISFGAGPHFCAGAAAARCIIADIALPLAFKHLNGLRLTGDVPFTGWAFRGPLQVPVAWTGVNG